MLGGDKIVPVLTLDDHPIRKERGPVVTELQRWYESIIDQQT